MGRMRCIPYENPILQPLYGVLFLSDFFNGFGVKVLVLDTLTPKKLRRPDSNERPLGYEPNELPTAPLRDVYSFRMQRYAFYFK